MPDTGQETAKKTAAKKISGGLSGARSYKVIKSNDLIQKARFDLSVQEQKIILYLISKIKPENDKLTTINFSIKEFCSVCGINLSGKNYIDISATIKNLADKSLWIHFDDGKKVLMRWIQRAIIDDNSGIMHIRFDELLEPYLFHLKKNFTQYEFYNILAMKSQYSIRLYEILRSYEYIHNVEFEIEDLKEKLQSGHYERYQDFRRRVLDTAVKEILDFSDINVTYVSVKEGAKYTRISFSVCRKKDLDENFAAWKRIVTAIEGQS